MRFAFVFLAILILSANAFRAEAQFAVTQDNDTVVFDLTNSGLGRSTRGNRTLRNAFRNAGFSTLWADADISVTESGYLVFDVIGHDAGTFNNEFYSDGDLLYSGRRIDVPRTLTGGTPLSQRYYIPAAGELPLDAATFRATRPSLNGQTADYQDRAFGIFIPDAGDTSNLTELYFAFDEARFTRDYDDLVIRASFISDLGDGITPVPAPGNLGLFLAALFLITYLQRKRDTAPDKGLAF